MALAIDASTPAVATQTSNTTATVTTASFTPPAGALLLVLWSCDQLTGGIAAPTITDSLGSPLTYTQTDWRSLADNASIHGQAAAWTAPVGSSAAMTVTVTTGSVSGERISALRVMVLTGQHATPVGAHGKSGSGSAASIAQSYTAQATGGWGFIADCDFDQTGAQTAGTGCTLINSANVGTAITYGFVRRTSADDVNGNSNTLNVTLPGTSTNLNWVYVEIVPAAAADDSSPQGQSFIAPVRLPWQRWPTAMQWPDSGAASLPTTADTGVATVGLAATSAAVHVGTASGRAPVGLAGAASAKKVAVVTATATMGAASVGTGRKVAPDTGLAAAGLSANAVHVQIAADTGLAELGLAATSTAKKVAPVACRATVGLAATVTAKKAAKDTGTAPVGLAASSTAAKVAKDTGTAALGLSANVSRVPATADTGLATIGLSARVATKKIVVAAAVASVGLAGAATARKVAKANQAAAFGVCGTATAKKVARTPAVAPVGLVPRFAGIDFRAVTARAYLGLQAQQHQCITYRSFVGATARPTTGTTVYATATTARPSTGVTAQPDTGVTEDPC